MSTAVSNPSFFLSQVLLSRNFRCLGTKQYVEKSDGSGGPFITRSCPPRYCCTAQQYIRVLNLLHHHSQSRRLSELPEPEKMLVVLRENVMRDAPRTSRELVMVLYGGYALLSFKRQVLAIVLCTPSHECLIPPKLKPCSLNGH